MKTSRILSFAVLGVLAALLVLGNVFHSVIRELLESSTMPLDFQESQLSRFQRVQNPDYTLAVSTDKAVYNKYERILVIAKMTRKGNTNAENRSVIEVEFSSEGRRIKSLTGQSKTRLIYDPERQIWTGAWYPETSDISGNIELDATGYPDTPEAGVRDKSGFYISELSPKFKLKKGVSFIGIDSLERISKRNILASDAREADWNAIGDWLNFLSADGVLMLGGVTKTFEESVSADSPWDNDKINESLVLADRIRQRGRHFGVWMKALRVEGIYLKKMGYSPSLSFSDGRLNEEQSAISLLDDNRKKRLERLYATYLNNDNVSYVGFSDLFLDASQGFELAEIFVQENQIPVPGNWRDMDENSRRNHVADLFRNREILQQFNRWKQYYTAQYLKSLIDSSPRRKPVFYSLSYEEAVSNPDLVSIILNAGVDFLVMNFVMPYDRILANLQAISGQPKISAHFNRIIVSFSIDYNNADLPGSDVSAIENFVNANLQIVKFGSDTLNANGILINDLYRAMFGKRGPYTPYEWMMGIGETIYRFKTIMQYVPLEIHCYAPQTVAYGEKFPLRFTVVNTSPKTVENFKLDFLPVFPGKPSGKNLTLPAIPPGREMELLLDIQTDSNASQFVRKKSFLGVRVSWLESREWGGNSASSFLLFKALKLRETASRSTNTNR